MSDRVTISCPPVLKNKLKELAGKDRRSLSGYVQVLIDKHLESHGMNPEKERENFKKSKKTVKKRKRASSQSKASS